MSHATTPTWEPVTITGRGGKTATVSMFRLGDWAAAQSGWGTTITYVPTGRTVGHRYPHPQSTWPALLARLNAVGPAPEPRSASNPAYTAWVSRVMAALS